jgi:hypothetical protein
MTKNEFRLLFEDALETAARNAEAKLGRTVPRRFEVELHGGAPKPRLLTVDQALNEIYLGGDRFHRVIDVGVRRISPDRTTVFLGISGHPASSLAETWNDPPGAGPFKQIISDEIATS